MRALYKQRVGQRHGLRRRVHWASVVLALLVLVMPLFPNAASAASTTVIGHPILNSGSGSDFTQDPSWSGTTYVTRVNGLTYSINAAAQIASVRVIGSKNVIPSGCTVTATVNLLSASGSTLATASANLARTGTSFNISVNTAPDVYYHTVARTAVTFAQSGTC